MTWVADQIAKGHLKVVRPRNLATLEPVYAPIRAGERVRTFWNPQKGHYVLPGTDHSFCGLGLCPPEDPDYLIHSGWDEVAYFVYDDRDPKTLCKQCSDGYAAWRLSQSGPVRSLPTESPVSADEWARMLGPKAELEKRKLSMVINRFEEAGIHIEEVTHVA